MTLEDWYKSRLGLYRLEYDDLDYSLFMDVMRQEIDAGHSEPEAKAIAFFEVHRV